MISVIFRDKELLLHNLLRNRITSTSTSGFSNPSKFLVEAFLENPNEHITKPSCGRLKAKEMNRNN